MNTANIQNFLNKKSPGFQLWAFKSQIKKKVYNEIYDKTNI